MKGSHPFDCVEALFGLSGFIQKKCDRSSRMRLVQMGWHIHGEHGDREQVSGSRDTETQMQSDETDTEEMAVR